MHMHPFSVDEKMQLKLPELLIKFDDEEESWCISDHVFQNCIPDLFPRHMSGLFFNLILFSDSLFKSRSDESEVYVILQCKKQRVVVELVIGSFC